MLCYRDQTFCISPDCKNECGRRLTDEIREAAKRWWGGDNPPIASAYLCTKTVAEESMTQKEENQ